MIGEFKHYIEQWKKELSYNSRTFTTFIVPLVAGAIATGAIKAVKYARKKAKKRKKKR